jgi:hypothetical protein
MAIKQIFSFIPLSFGLAVYGFSAQKGNQFSSMLSMPTQSAAGVHSLDQFITRSDKRAAVAMKWFKAFWQALRPPPKHREFGEALNKCTPRARQVLALARREADRFQHNFVGTEHLLLGLIRLGQGVAVNVLGKMGLDLETVRIEVEKQVGPGPERPMHGIVFPYTPCVKKVLALADKERKALHHTYLGTEHILLGLLHEGDGVAARALKNFGVDVNVTRQNILKELDPNDSPPAEDMSAPE